MVMWAVSVCAVLCVCAVVQGGTLKGIDPNSAVVASGGVHRRSVTPTKSPDFNWNNVADNLIELAKADIRQKGKTQLSLPDVQEEKSFDLGFLKLHYKLKASQGTVDDFTSFRRTGDVLLTKERTETLQGAIPVTLDRLKVHYGSYEVKVLGFDISGVLGGTMENISIVMTIYGEEVGQGCTASLTDVKVTDLGKLSVDLTGLGALNGVTSSIVRYFMEQRKIDIVSIVESVLLKELKKVLEEYQCDELHSLFLLAGK